MTEEDFYSSIQEWIKADVSSWNHITILAYFCFKYEKATKTQFRLVRSKKGPISTKESADFAKLFAIFAPENYKDLSSDEKAKIRPGVNKKIYNYINWMFDYKFRAGNINGTRAFLAPALLNEYERMYARKLKEWQNKNTIDALIKWCKENAPNILDTHQLEKTEDLRLIKRYADMYNLPITSPERTVLHKAESLGLIDKE